MAQTGFPLPLRNALAELAIAGLDDPPATAALAWLAGDRQTAPASAAAARLAAVHLVEGSPPTLLAVHAPWADTVRAHARRAGAAGQHFQSLPHPVSSAADGAVRKAAALWREQLFFEVHEVLEAEWKHREGPVRTALQGLIQVAVAFHHLAHGNQRGARSLFHDGRERLAAAPDALPVLDTGALLAATADWMAAVSAGAWPGTPPALPLVEA
jgi:uncharacterized protein